MLLLLALACAPNEPAPACSLATDRLVQTKDGATISLHHHPGHGAPVLLVHGVTSNHHFWDMDAEHSGQRWLVAHGYDAWSLDLRGHGDARNTAAGAPQIHGWNIDDYGIYDVAAAVDFVKAVTGYQTIGYVGHSLGGMVGAIYAANGGAQNLSGFVVLGSPATFSKDSALVRFALTLLKATGAGTFWVDMGVLGDAAAATGPGLSGGLQYKLYNPAHLAKDTERLMLRTIASPMSREEGQHLARMVDHQRFESADGKKVWTAEFLTGNLPVMAIAGGGDEVGKPAWVKPWAAGPGSEYVEVPEYGHLDLALGEDAEKDIFPLIARWLDTHPARRLGQP